LYNLSIKTVSILVLFWREVDPFLHIQLYTDDVMPVNSSTDISSSDGKECPQESAFYTQKTIVKLPVRVDFVGG
jgi:hypothetical protein